MKFVKLFLPLFLINISILNSSEKKHEDEKSNFIFSCYLQLDSKVRLDFDLETAKVMEKTCLHDKFKQAFIDKYRNNLEKIIAPGCESILLKTRSLPLVSIYMPTVAGHCLGLCGQFSLNSNIVRVDYDNDTSKIIDISNIYEPKFVDEKTKIGYAPHIYIINFANKKIVLNQSNSTFHATLSSDYGDNRDNHLTLTSIGLGQLSRFWVQTFSPDNKYVLIVTLDGQIFIGNIEATWKVNDFNLAQILFLIELSNTVRFESLNRKEMLEIFETFSPEVKEHISKFVRKIRIQNEISDITRLDPTDGQANLSRLITDFVE